MVGSKNTATAISALMMAVSTPVYADDDAIDNTAIIVTARKKNELLKDVPISITAFSEENILRQGITSVERVADLTPGLQFDSGVTPGDIRPSLRGIPLMEGRSNVALLVDGVDVTGLTLDDSFGGASSLLNIGLMDLARVEVIKGPQSVYFGRSAFSGAIQFVSKDPSDTAELKTNLGYGSNGLLEVSAHVGGPLVKDVLKMKISGSHRQFDGFYKNPGNGQKFGNEKTSGLATALIFTPSQNSRFTARVSYIDQKAGPPAVYGVPRSALGADQIVSSEDFNPSLIQQNADYYFHGAEAKILRTVITTEIDLSSQISLRTITGYNHTDSRNEFDFDRTAETVPSGVPVAGTDRINCLPRTCVAIFDYDMLLKQFSQEVRLSFENIGPLDFMVGGYFADERADQTEYNRYLGSAPFVTQDRYSVPPRLFEQNTRSYSGFASFTFKPTEKLKITAEGRYNHDKITGAAPEYTDSTQIGSIEQTIFAQNSFNAFNPRVSVDWKLPDQSLLYASVSRGSKPGGLNLSRVIDAVRHYNQESIWTYEAGLKTTLANGVVSIDAAVYYSDYKDAQITDTCFGKSSPFGPEELCVNADAVSLNYIVNAKKARIYGAEADARINFDKNFFVTASYAYTDSKLVDFAGRDNIIGGTANIQYGGNKMPLIPTHSILGTVNYESEVNNDWNFFLNFTSKYRSKRFARFDNRVTLAEKTTVDAQFGVQSEKIKALFFVENLLNNLTPDYSRYGPLLNPLRTPGEFIVAPRGRSFGLRASLSY